MPLLNRNKKVTCEISGAETKTDSGSSLEELFCLSLHYAQCRNFSTKSQNFLSYHFAKEHSAPKPTVTFKCTLCCQKFPGSHALRHHRNTQHSFFIKIKNVELDQITDEVDDTNLKEALHSCQHFRVYLKLEKARHRVVNSAKRNLNAARVFEMFDQQFRLCSENKSSFWILFELYRTWKVQICLRTRK